MDIQSEDEVEERGLNEQATEILEAMGREQETSLPILDLIFWAYGGMYPDDEKQNETMEHLMTLTWEQAMRIIEGPNQENSLPELTLAELERLRTGTEREREQVEAGLRRNLRQLLKDVHSAVERALKTDA